MKILYRLTICFFLFVGLVIASDLPKGVYDIDDLDKALEKSREKGKAPIMFLVTVMNSNCGSCRNVTNLMIQEMVKRTVIVYAGPNEEKLPESVRKAVEGENRGKYIPYAFVMNDEMNQLLGILRFQEVDDDADKAFRVIKRKIREAKAENSDSES